MISSAVTARFMDLGPYLAGGEVKYPSLTAIPSDSWRMSIFGALRGIPMPAASSPGIVPLYREDVFDKKGCTVPESADEFLSWAKKATSVKAEMWARGDLRWSAAGFFGVKAAGALGWNVDEITRKQVDA